MPYHQTLEKAEKLKAAGVPHELIVIPGVDHVFIGKTPEQTHAKESPTKTAGLEERKQ